MVVVRCPILVGRDDELGTLLDVARAARAGSGSWVAVVGEAGIGKTRLVQEVAHRCEESGVRVGVGRCSSSDATTPCRPIAELLLATATTGDPPPEVVPYLAALGRFVPAWRGAATLRSESAAVIGESVLRALAWLGGGSFLAIIEDLQWADSETVAVCAYLRDNAERHGVSVIATSRTGEEPDEVRALRGRGTTIEIGALAEAQVSALVEACTGTRPGADALDQLVMRSSGVPLLVEDLLDDLEGTSTRFAELVRARLARVGRQTQRAVVAAALVGERFEWSTVAEAVGDDRAAAAAIDEAVGAGLFTSDAGHRFRHALTRDLVLAELPDVRRELEPLVAATLARRAGTAELARAGELWVSAGAPDRAVDAFERAATSAEASGETGVATRLLERALDYVDDTATRTRLQRAQLALLAARGEVSRALELGGATLDLVTGDPDAEREVRLVLARLCLASGDLDGGGAHLEWLASTDPGDAEAHIVGARLAMVGPGEERRSSAEHLARQATALAGDERPDLAVEGLELAARCARSRSLDDAAALLERALVVAGEHRLEPARLRLLNELGTVEMLRSADGSRLQRALDGAMEVGALDVAAETLVNIASLHAMRGELDDARAVAQRAHEASMRLGLAPIAAAALTIEGVGYGFAGDEANLEARLRAARALAPDDDELDAFAWAAGRGLCALLREDRAAAEAALRRGVRADAPIGSLDAARPPLLLLLTVTGAATAEDEAEARATATPGSGWSDLWLGYAAAARFGVANDASRAIDQMAAADAVGARHPIFCAIGRRLVAEAALRDGWGDPVGWLRAAEATFVAGGQDRIASACRTLLERAGVRSTRRRGADRALPASLLQAGVTAREAEVLALVRERLGNTEIAARLYLSPRTVEKHVANLLRKLDVTDRRALAQRPPDP